MTLSFASNRTLYLQQSSASDYGKFYRIDVVVSTDNTTGGERYWVVKNWGKETADGPRHRVDAHGQYAVEEARVLGVAQILARDASARKEKGGYAPTQPSFVALPNPVVHRIKAAMNLTTTPPIPVQVTVGQPQPAFTNPSAPKKMPAELDLSPVTALGWKAVTEARNGQVAKAIELRDEMLAAMTAARAVLDEAESMFDLLQAELRKAI